MKRKVIKLTKSLRKRVVLKSGQKNNILMKCIFYKRLVTRLMMRSVVPNAMLFIEFDHQLRTSVFRHFGQHYCLLRVCPFDQKYKI